MANYSSLIARQFGLPEAELKLILHSSRAQETDDSQGLRVVASAEKLHWFDGDGKRI